jgi:hypothetical protein
LPVLEETVTEKSNSDPLLLSLKVLKSIFKGKLQNSNYHKQASRVQNILLGALNHDYSKVVASGLQVTGLFFSTLRAQDGSLNQNYVSLVKPFYTAVFAKLSKVDIDQDVKKRSIIAAADLVSVSNAVLSSEDIAKVMQVLTERLKQDLTRESALKAITYIVLNETSNSY